jgi:SAM-dependent methyltransferase
MKYIGNELEIFANATTWKKYYKSFIKPYLKGRVLEVGAGIGTTTSVLCETTVMEWVCLEPDLEFVKILETKIDNHELPAVCAAKSGTLQQLAHDDTYDCALYIDVLEHIEEDQAELMSIMQHIRPGGHLIVLAPAHQWLFTPFDKAIGHFRRYTKKSLSSLTPQNGSLEKLIYLDSAGLLLSLANKMALRQAMPTVKQIVFWDRFIVPISMIVDRIVGFRLGKSIMAVWKHEK